MDSEKSHRLYVKGRHLGYQRGKRNTNPNVSLLALEGVSSTEAARYYLGKKVAFVYRATSSVRGSKCRVIWGKIRRTHGNSGAVRASFKHNLPPKSFGASVRVMLYPSST
ncbi:60S ribosomal protein L33 [Cucurbitaria berberidis CBS 394.84]|uniref:60S ribosomal protein L33 n=1 Tax=Cucurbitaria berberidis CBS 394.84 TaxID=1168544 RepID=A0A9P4L9X2_9PLEO|nr:60S ribosomal protein L33 [Cucurbitaria berberidis CBS 394.84]KAF1847731.1 60S ribosomal protein L33 [Cucurbitaria berberidis CBS 394.84]